LAFDAGERFAALDEFAEAIAEARATRPRVTPADFGAWVARR
jgi:hypothetical protein